jgi:multiple sugar transport system permease protein
MKEEEKNLCYFLLPAITVLLLISVYPLVRAIFLSLQNVDLRVPWRSEYVGVANYLRLLSDNRFLNSLKISLAYSTLTLVFSTFSGVAVAFFVNGFLRGRLKSLMLFFFLFPFVVPRVSVALMWKFMYSPLIGVYNYFLSKAGFSPVPFLSSPRLALLSVIVVDVWQWSFFIAALVVSSLELLPREPLEAAQLDGASSLQVIRYVTIPLLKPSLLFIIFIKWVESLRAFDLIYNMTKGGPGVVTETLDLYAYVQGIAVSGEISYASSMAIVMLFMTTLIITLVNRKWTTKAK